MRKSGWGRLLLFSICIYRAIHNTISMNEEIALWIEQAKIDLDGARYNLEGRKLSVVALLVEQSVEKALKALFLKKFAEIPKVHDLVFLARKLNLPEKLFQYCKQISPLYMPSRYPDAPGFKKASDYSFNECKETVEKVEELVKWIEKQL